ncbi:multicopper polyphenol oxidase [Paenibacillus swuensis]|uniref:Purine nucleoside phosphorylase n=1 Tax=Paenibacillus swuensis TaxID=1178515 RepID=A0A172TK27_9BACL|nr:peptidoglycan editing factor PgeF [Paenibacillus swuensis]ANE47380.1 multicopper polyphenol oxidase [Paenibacillus swuensis]
MDPFVQHEADEQTTLFYIDSWIREISYVTAGFTSRRGGASKGVFDSLNCALHVQDDADTVISNRTGLALALGMDPTAWTCAEQVHGSRVHVVTSTDRGAGRENRESAIQDTDAIITNLPDVLLTSFYADCVPLFFLDPVNKAVGLAHAGWKGTVQRIASKTVEAMGANYGTRPEQLLTAIGPSIGGCCYEVDQGVITHVQSLGFSDEIGYKTSGTGKYMLDLKIINRELMLQAGILPSHIEVSEWCTGCRTDLFYSHRKENGRTGRMASWIALKEEVMAL